MSYMYQRMRRKGEWSAFVSVCSAEKENCWFKTIHNRHIIQDFL